MKAPGIRTGKKDEARRKMLELLQSGEYKPGERLPPESELVNVLGCCRSTVREAVGLLVSEGYLSRVRNSGTFVAHSKQHRYTIAAIFPDLCREPNDSYTANILPPMVSAIVAEARLHNVDVILYGCGCDDIDLERENIRSAMERQVDGVIIYYIGEDRNNDALEELYAAGIPLIFLDRYVEKFNPDYVVTDNFGGTSDAVTAIAHSGVKSIYYITSTEQYTSARDRMLGYTAAVNSLGLPCNVVFTHMDLIGNWPYTHMIVDKESAEYMCLRRTIESIKLPAALFSLNPIINAVTNGILEDLKIPKDQIILGHFDSDPPTRSTDMCCFEVDQPFADMGTRAVQIIMDKISGNTERQQIALKPKLTIHNVFSFACAGSEADAFTALARS